MSESVETILRKVLKSRERLPVAHGDCFVCRKTATSYRENDITTRFCGNNCNKAEYYASNLFPLGYKRAAEVINEKEELRLSNFPREIQALVILLLFDYRIESRKEWDQLMRLKWLIDKHYLLLIDEEVIPYFHYIDKDVIARMTKEEVSRLVRLRKLVLPRGSDYTASPDWNLILGSMKELVDLDLYDLRNEIIIQTEKLPQLTRLACKNSTQDTNLKGLTNLNTLVLAEKPNITDEGIAHLINLTRLDIGSKSKRYSDITNIKLTREGLNQLSNLQKLVLARVDKGVISNEHISDLTQLKKLHLFYAGIDNIETLTNLQVLNVDKSDREALLGEFFPKLTNLTKLTICQGHFYNSIPELTKLLDLRLKNRYDIDNLRNNEIGVEIFEKLTQLERLELVLFKGVSDRHLTPLVNLKSLSLARNEVITDNGITFLTNLTFLNLEKNYKITLNALKHLRRLRRLKESSTRTYRVENGVITL